MNGYSTQAQSLTIAPVIAGITTNQVISREGFPITAGGAQHFVAKIVASGVTVVGAVTAMLQTAIGSDWQDSKTVTISADGIYYIKLLAERTADQTFLPLLNKGRVVVTTTNAGDAVTIASVDVLQEL